MYKITFKEWGCKDDLKFWKYDDVKVNWRLLFWKLSVSSKIKDFAKKEII